MRRDDEGRGVDLQEELRDLLCLAVVGDHLRWVVAGDDRDLGGWLDEMVPHWRSLAREVAQRLVAVGVPPDGRVRSLAQDIPLNWVPEGWLPADEARRLLDQRLHVLRGWSRERARTADPESARVFELVAAGLARTP